MTLRLRADVNGERIGTIEINNHGHPDATLTFPYEDDLRLYQCVLYRTDHTPLAAWVSHNRSDGWMVLAHKALTTLIERNP